MLCAQCLEARFPARRREERGCGPVTGKDRASCQSGGWAGGCHSPGPAPMGRRSPLQAWAGPRLCLLPPLGLRHGFSGSRADSAASKGNGKQVRRSELLCDGQRVRSPGVGGPRLKKRRYWMGNLDSEAGSLFLPSIFYVSGKARPCSRFPGWLRVTAQVTEIAHIMLSDGRH